MGKEMERRKPVIRWEGKDWAQFLALWPLVVLHQHWLRALYTRHRGGVGDACVCQGDICPKQSGI